MFRHHVFTGLVCLAISPFAVADIVHLKDGTNLEGDVKRNDDGWLVIVPGSPTIRIAADKVASIELKSSSDNGPKVATDHLASLRRSVENLTDIKEVQSRYQRFIDQTKDASAVADAKKDLAIWQDRADKGMIKIGTKWILPGDRAKLVDQSAGLADQARQLLKQGRAKEADPMLVEAVADDPTNASALYLIGLLRYQQDQIPAARKALEAVVPLVPNHAPTSNNLAVVLWRQRQFVAALANYDTAMLSAPVNKDVLDNVSTALQSLPTEFRSSPITQRVTRHFQEQDKSLQEQMSKSGWHRYGTMWVTDKEMDEIKQQEKEMQAKLDAMAAEFEKTKEQVAQIDSKIEETQAGLRRIEVTSYVRDPNTGSMVRLAYPPLYYELQRDQDRYQKDRQTAIAKMDALTASAKAIQKKLPAQRASDVQKVIGPEGTPLKTAATLPVMTTMPTTQAAVDLE